MKTHELRIQGNNLRKTDNLKKTKSWTKFDEALVFFFSNSV